MQAPKVGIREFRADLTGYIAASAPVAVTRHGQTVGYFIPVQVQRAEADLEALRKAGRLLDELLSAQGVDAENLVADFKEARMKKKKNKKSAAPSRADAAQE